MNTNVDKLDDKVDDKVDAHKRGQVTNKHDEGTALSSLRSAAQRGGQRVAVKPQG